MKKIIALLCASLMMLSLAACGEDKPPVNNGGTTNTDGRKLGVGSVNTIATESGEKLVIKTTVAAVVLDKDGKITECELDEAEFPLELKEGVLQDVLSLLTKDEDESYDDTWDDQVEAFCKYVEGKTGAEVSGIAATDGKAEIAGCDLVVTDFIQAVHRATEAAKDKNIAATDDLKLAVTVAKPYDFKAEKPQFDVEMAAVTLAENDKITACMTDSAQIKATVEGNAFATAAGATQTKREMGDAYGMKAASSIKKEWYEQADAFDAYAVGKTADELNGTSVAADGKTDAVSGCTMAVSGLLKNAVKAAKD